MIIYIIENLPHNNQKLLKLNLFLFGEKNWVETVHYLTQLSHYSNIQSHSACKCHKKSVLHFPSIVDLLKGIEKVFFLNVKAKHQLSLQGPCRWKLRTSNSNSFCLTHIGKQTKKLNQKYMVGGFLDGPAVKIPCFQCRGCGFDPWLGY